MKQKYKEGSLKFNGLVFIWKYITTESDKNGEHEVFNIEVFNPQNKKKIRQEFHNSIIECGISQKIERYKNLYSFSEFFNLIRPKMWAGYDENLQGKKIKSFKELDKKRIWWLMLSVLIDFSENIEVGENFYEFCDSFGYDRDSREAENIYKKVIDYKEKIRSLELTEKQERYFLKVVRQEKDQFTDKDLTKATEDQY